MNFQLWLKAEDDQFYPMPTQEHRTIIDELYGFTEATDFDSSEQHQKAIYTEYRARVVELYGDAPKGIQKQMAEDYISAITIMNFYEEGELGGNPSRHDACPYCGTTELLCGHNGSGCSQEPEEEVLEECETCNTQVPEADLEFVQDPLCSDEDQTVAACSKCRSPNGY